KGLGVVVSVVRFGKHNGERVPARGVRLGIRVDKLALVAELIAKATYDGSLPVRLVEARNGRDQRLGIDGHLCGVALADVDQQRLAINAVVTSVLFGLEIRL